jgi:hypothetical protein
MSDSIRGTGDSVVIVQPGWHIFDRDGEHLGEVVSVESGMIILRGRTIGSDRLAVPKETVTEQEEAEMRAHVSLRASEIDGAA